jgi:hypothetical protein
MSEPFRTDEARLVRRNGLRLALASLPLATIVPLLAYGLLGGTELATSMIPVLAVLGVGSLWSALKSNKDPRYEAGRLEIDARGGIAFDGRELAAPGDLEVGFVVPSEDGPRVLLRRRGLALPLVLAVPDVESGRAVLSALGLDASQAVAEARAMSPILASQAGLAALAVGVPLAFFAAMQAFFHSAMPRFAGVVALGVSFVVATLLVAAAAASRRVVVGVDGVLVRWMFSTRFIPFARVREVRRFGDPKRPNDQFGVELEVDGSRPVRLVVGRKLEAGDAALLAERIEQARGAFATRRSSTIAHELGRGSGDVGGWLRRLRGLGAGANADMRTAPIADVELARVLEDPSLGDEERVGAALALSAGRGPEQRERVRVVARTVAAPRLRVALEKVAAASNEDEYAEALASVEEEESAAGEGVGAAPPRARRV